MGQDERSKKSRKETVNEALLRAEAEVISDSDILPPEEDDLEEPVEQEEEEETEIATRDYHVSEEIGKKLQTKPYGEDPVPETKPLTLDTGDILIEQDANEEPPPATAEVGTEEMEPPAVPQWEDTQQHQIDQVRQPDELDDTLDDSAEPPTEERPLDLKEEPPGPPPWNQELDDTGRDEGDLEDTPTFPEQEVAGGVQVSWDEPLRTQQSSLPDPGPTQIEKDFKPGVDPAQEKTLIFGDGAEAGPREFPFLIVVQGEEEGREIELIKDEMTLGRGADNDLVFPDIACSRRHALLERQGEDYIITDLGSGNGTLLNGNSVQREVLKDGDEIEVGSTILQFIRPGQASEPKPESRGHAVTAPRTIASGSFTRLVQKLLADPRRRNLVVYGGGCVIGFLFVLLIVKAFVGSPGESKADLEEKRRLQERRQQVELSNLLDDARQLVKEKKWNDAAVRIQLALKVDENNKDALDYRNYVTREQRASTAVQSARRYFGERNWDKAIAELNTVSEESEYFDEASRLKREIEEKYTEELLSQGRELMQQSKPAQAVLKFNEVLKRDPENQEAAGLKRRAEDAQASLAAQLAKMQKKNQKKNRPRPRKAPERHGKYRGKIAQVVSLYKQGEIDKAIEKAELIGEKRKAVGLKQFKSVYRLGMQRSNNQGQVAKALKPLMQALKMDKSISGGVGVFHDKITEKLGNVYYVKAVDAHTRQKYPEAYKAYRNALKFRPNNELAKQRLRDLEKTAKKLYEEAYVIKANNPDQAVNKLSIVLKIIPPENVYYGKAKRLKSRILGPLSREPDSDSGF